MSVHGCKEDPDTIVNSTQYCPIPENVWVGETAVDVLFDPEVGSPKFQEYEVAVTLELSIN